MRLKVITPILLSLLLISENSNAQPQKSIKVIANTSDSGLTLSRQQIRNLFMGSDSGHNLSAVSLPPRNISRVIFNTKVVGLTESRIQSYWAQMRFSGRNKPPKEFDSIKQMVDYLKKTPGAVGYIPAEAPTPEGLIVIYKAS